MSINLFLLLPEGIYQYECMMIKKRLDERSLLEKEDFYSSLNTKHITVGDFRRAKRFWRDSEIENRGDYHDL